jgi:hypothetical protein
MTRPAALKPAAGADVEWEATTARPRRADAK